MSEGDGRAHVLSLLADAIAAAASDRPLLVAIDGVDAAGKTMLADDLANVLRMRGEEVVQVSIDGFHHPAAVRHARATTSPARSYYEDSFDYESFRRLVLQPLRQSHARTIIPRIFDHETDTPVHAEPVDVGDHTIVVVDGIFLGRPELEGHWDVWIYVDVDPPVARARGVARDEHLYGPATRDRYRARYEPGQALYHGAVNPAANADIVVDNTIPAAPKLRRAGGPGD